MHKVYLCEVDPTGDRLPCSTHGTGDVSLMSLLNSGEDAGGAVTIFVRTDMVPVGREGKPWLCLPIGVYDLPVDVDTGLDEDPLELFYVVEAVLFVGQDQDPFIICSRLNGLT